EPGGGEQRAPDHPSGRLAQRQPGAPGLDRPAPGRRRAGRGVFVQVLPAGRRRPDDSGRIQAAPRDRAPGATARPGGRGVLHLGRGHCGDAPFRAGRLKPAAPPPMLDGMSTTIDLSAPGYQSLDRPLEFTPSAAAKVRELIAEEGNDALKLRVYIQGGGCSGFQYGFEFDEEQGDDDLAVATDGVTLLVDPLSLQYLMGAAVDYVESLHGAQFTIRNPNAKSTCGCGSSFTA